MRSGAAAKLGREKTRIHKTGTQKVSVAKAGLKSVDERSRADRELRMVTPHGKRSIEGLRALSLLPVDQSKEFLAGLYGTGGQVLFRNRGDHESGLTRRPLLAGHRG
jgi:hypothetical protein